jgi:hypothetical protein
MSIVCYVVGAAILSIVANQHNWLQLGFCMRGMFALESYSQTLIAHGCIELASTNPLTMTETPNHMLAWTQLGVDE